MSEIRLPDDVRFVRTTPMFTEETVPAGLLAAHQVAAETWAVLTVRSGSLRFGFDDEAADSPLGERHLAEGETQVIPPVRPHHLVVEDGVTFDIAFYRTIGD